MIEEIQTEIPFPKIGKPKSAEEIAREQGNPHPMTLEDIEAERDGFVFWDTEEEFQEFLKIIEDGRKASRK